MCGRTRSPVHMTIKPAEHKVGARLPDEPTRTVENGSANNLLRGTKRETKGEHDYREPFDSKSRVLHCCCNNKEKRAQSRNLIGGGKREKRERERERE